MDATTVAIDLAKDVFQVALANQVAISVRNLHAAPTLTGSSMECSRRRYDPILRCGGCTSTQDLARPARQSPSRVMSTP
jgi:hypothetical protein